MMKKKNKGLATKIIDAGGLGIAIIVDLILNVIGYASISPNSLLRIAFIGIAIIIVLFIPRSWYKRQYPLYVIFVIIAFFFDYSIVLEATRMQSESVQTIENQSKLVETVTDNGEVIEVATYKDVNLAMYQKWIDESNATLEKLHQEHFEAVRESTLVDLNKQITTEEEKLAHYMQKYEDRVNKVEDGTAVTTQLSADRVINAIPTAFREKRYIAMIVFALIFIGLQAIIASSTEQKKKKIKDKKKVESKDTVVVKKEKDAVLEKKNNKDDDKSYRKIAKEEK